MKMTLHVSRLSTAMQHHSLVWFLPLCSGSGEPRWSIFSIYTPERGLSRQPEPGRRLGASSLQTKPQSTSKSL